MECLTVFAHLRKQVAGEGVDSFGGRGVGADEDNEVVMAYAWSRLANCFLHATSKYADGFWNFEGKLP